MIKTRDNILNSLASLFVMGWLVAMIAWTSPTVTQNEAFIFFYPLYEPTWVQNNYVLGSFFWVYFYSWLALAYLNAEYDVFWYKFINGSSMWAYLSHYMWIVIVCQIFVRPFNMDFGPAAIINLVVSEALILASYWGLEKISERYCKKK